MSLWFSGSAVVPALRAEWHLGAAAVNWLTLAVQVGFVCGTLLSRRSLSLVALIGGGLRVAHILLRLLQPIH